MRSILDLAQQYNIEHLLVLDPDTRHDPNTITQEAKTNPVKMMGARRASIKLNARPWTGMEVSDKRAESIMPAWLIVDDEILICIIECMDLGEFPLDPHYHDRLIRIADMLPDQAAVVGCDSSYVLKDGVEWIAHTIGSDPYPLNPIHAGCGLDLILIRRLDGTFQDIANGMATVAFDLFSAIDDIIGPEPYGYPAPEIVTEKKEGADE